MRHLLLLVLLSLTATAHAKVRVVTTTSDLAALAREVGGDLVEADSIAKGYQDPHFVEAKPSYLLRLKKADLFIQVGLELEAGWAPTLLTNARNDRILPGSPGFLEASEGCDVLDKRPGADRSQGDVHPLGNPHLWLDPENGRVIARHIAERLKRLDAAHAADYDANLRRFEAQLAQKRKDWDKLAAPLKGARIVTYHNSWPNFARAFGFTVVDFVEPRPGIPPSPAHVQALTARIRREKIPLVLIEPYFDDKLPAKIAADGGAKLLLLPPSVGGEKGLDGYFDLFDHALGHIASALEAKP